ncbi:MAG: AraC family transcriptional regulator [Lachnospiraceae bacterium]|nr:AraC family transcriptional regulator [Lachnospiraceae bacterium]MCI1302847.1 AraC family transcriptional regulator [Lachnospiraceae bacterium]MCI1332096.1 AraC family transcriptional regulator [Lachnospiraceae bacterium]
MRKIGRSVYYQCLMDINRIEPTIASTTAPIGGICLEYCGTQECPPGHMWEGYRKNYVIHTVLRGKGTFTAGGKTYQIGAGQAFAMFPGEFYHYTADMNDPWEYCWIGFEGFRCDAYVKRIGFEKRKCYVVSVPKPEEIWRKVTKITDYGSLTCLDEVRRLSLLLDVLAELMEGSSEAAEQQLDYPGSTYVRYLVDYLDSHYAEKIRLSQIAEKIGVSRSYLTQSFKTLMHMPPKEYLTRVRMRQASQLLLTTAKTITEISRLCGYDDSMAFDKAFRNYYQENPGTYRKNYKAHGDERPYGAMYSLNSVL